MGRVSIKPRTPSKRRASFLAASLVVSSLLSLESIAASGYFPLVYSARLTNANGSPVQDPLDVDVKFYSAETGGTQLGQNFPYTAVFPTDGVINLTINLMPAQVEAVFGDGSEPVFIEITAAGKSYPRQKYSYVPLALRVPVDGKTLSFGSDGTLGLALKSMPGANQFLTKNGGGELVWASPAVVTTSSIQGRAVSTTAPQTGQVLTYSGTEWIPQTLASSPSPLGVAGGGTGATSFTNNGILVGAGAGPVSATAPGTLGNVLTVGASGPEFGRVNLGSGAAVTGTLAIANGGTGADLTTTGGAGQFLKQISPGGAVTVATISASEIPALPATKIPQATNAADGYLTAADWTAFNAKQNALGYTPLNKNGDTMAGALEMNANGLAHAGNINMAAFKTLGLSEHTTDPTGLTTSDKGKTWFNATTSEIKYWDGTAVKALASVGGILDRSNGGTGVNSSATFPTSGVVVTRDATETLTNKTLSSVSVDGASSIGGSTTINTTGSVSTGALTALTLTSQGDASIRGNGTSASKLVLNDKGPTNYVALKAPDTLASQLVWELPGTNGSAGQVLSTNGAGILSWISGVSPTGAASGDLTGNFPSPTLAAVGTAGAYTKVTTDSKGRVISGATLEPSDLPPISASSLTTGTLAVANGGTGAATTSANYVFAGPTTGTGAPGFRTLVAGDLPVMVGANGTAAGTAGIVPGPGATDNGKFLRGDGSWATPANPAGGTDNQIQYNSGGALSGDANFVYAGGNVGIGTTSPGATLDLVSTSTASQYAMITALQPNLPVNGLNYINLGTSASNNNQGALYFRNVGSGSADNTMSIGFYGTGDRLAVLAGGNVGISTTSPGSKLQVNGNVAIGYTTTTSAPASGLAVNGNVGIGTTAPERQLHVHGGTGGAYLKISDADTGATTTDGLFVGYDLNEVAYISNAENTDLRIDTNNLERIRVSSNGNVGVGTTSPNAKFQVNGQAASVIASISSLTVDFNSGNIQTNSVAAGTLVLNNMIDGASYTLVLTNATGGNYVLSGSSVSAWKCSPACAGNTVTVTGGTHTVVSLMKIGTTGYVSWINNL